MNETFKSIASALAIIVIQVAALFGLEISEDEATSIILCLITLGATCYAIWKNHNFTEDAQESQAIVNAGKFGEQTVRKDEEDKAVE